MADDKKISDLTVATAPTGAELVEIVQGGVNKQTTTQDIADLAAGAALTDGNGTTANGSAADLGGTISGNTTLTLGGDFWLRLLGIIGTTARFIVDGVNNTRKSIQFRTGNVPRWDIHIEGDETGSNAEANLHIERFDDAGAFIAEALTISRATGVANFPVGPTVPTAAPGTNTTQAASTAFVQAVATELGDLAIGSITGAVSLVSGDLGTLWELSGTTTNYTVDLPTAIGNDEKTIIFKGLDALTFNVTIAGILGQTIDGLSTVVMGGGSSLTLLSDGANWTIVNEIGSWINYTPVWDGFSVDPAVAFARYFRVGKMCTVAIRCTSSGTSDATNLTVTLPFAAAASSIHFGLGVNNSAVLNTTARIDIVNGSSTATAYISPNASAWTGSGGKQLNFTATYEIQ